MKTPVRKFKF